MGQISVEIMPLPGSVLRENQQYIGGGRYREHLRLTAPLMVLTVATSPERVERMLRLVQSDVPEAAPYLLFQSWDDFGAVFRPPEPNARLLTDLWLRVAGARFAIDRA